MKIWIAGSLLAAAALIGACDKKSTPGTTQAAAGRCPHDIKQEKCPFCNPGLIESDGFCGEHAVAEALCVKCRPYLKAAFRAKGDWCAEHTPEGPKSQCFVCHPELKDKVTEGHGVAPAGPGK